MNVTGVFPGKTSICQSIALAEFYHFYWGKDGLMVPNFHFISCDADSLILFLGLIIEKLEFCMPSKETFVPFWFPLLLWAFAIICI